MRPVTLTSSSSSAASSDPILLTFGTNVYTTDVRIAVKVQKRKTRRKRKKQHSHYEEWTISILNSQRADEAIYECQERRKFKMINVEDGEESRPYCATGQI